jgi:Flp pilus assembly protein TadD
MRSSVDTRSPWFVLSLPRGRFLVALIALVATTCLATCSKAPETDEALMKAGLDALYTRKDANAAATVFRKVLERNPTHYGATYQLATALDRAGKPDEARPLWEKVLAMAEATRDTDTAGTARARLGKVEVVSDEPLMKAGLDALYTQKDPNTAAALFRKVLERNPTHYGATYQLAAALDRAGKPDEARPLWEKVLPMAEGYNDKPTADMARARLGREQ